MSAASVSSLQFVPCERFPSEPKQGDFYYSEEFRSSLHLCACGCGSRVVLPIKPAGWNLQSDGQTFSLSPSVGNREFPCRSHYLIKRGAVVWLAPMSDGEVADSRSRDAEHIKRLHRVSMWQRLGRMIRRVFRWGRE